MTRYSRTPASPPDLRERRRRELVRTIALAAVDLFEKNGFAATTIDDIAAAAGVSRTTFFRHCATKESAVLVDDAGLEQELVDIAAEASATHPLRDLEAAWEEMTDLFDADGEGRDRFLRVRRLMNDNPPLHAAGLERDAALTARVANALAEQPGLPPLDAQAVAESFSLGMRLTFDEWVRRANGKTVPLREIYGEVRGALRRARGAATR